MTEFEQQIAEALLTIELSDGIPLGTEDAELLAPRVAAAIEAALPDGSITVMDGLRERLQNNALAALRGEK